MTLFQSILDYLHTSVFDHFATDLLGTILIFVSMYFLGKKKRIGFVLNALACALWVIWHIKWGSPSGAIMNAGLVFVNVWSWNKWKK